MKKCYYCGKELTEDRHDNYCNCRCYFNVNPEIKERKKEHQKEYRNRLEIKEKSVSINKVRPKTRCLISKEIFSEFGYDPEWIKQYEWSLWKLKKGGKT